MTEAVGDGQTAARLLGAAESQREAASQGLVPWLEPFLDQVPTEASTALGKERFDRALAKGRSLSRQEAIALALDSAQAAAVPRPACRSRWQYIPCLSHPVELGFGGQQRARM